MTDIALIIGMLVVVIATLVNFIKTMNKKPNNPNSDSKVEHAIFAEKLNYIIELLKEVITILRENHIDRT